MGYEQGSNYFEYYDNGCRYEYKGADVKNNRLYFNMSNGFF